MASLHGIQTELDTIIKPLLREILQKLDKEASTTEIVENAAAKIIAEIKKCDCNKEIIDLLHNHKNTEIITRVPPNSGKLYQYSYPNNSVGNENLGTGRNMHSLSWPPK